MWGVLVLLAVAGCDRVWDLVDVIAAVDAAPPVDAVVDAPPCPGTRRDLPASPVDDTMLLDVTNCNTSIRYGVDPIVNIGQNGTSRVLVRFSVSAEILAALDQGVATGGQLTLSLRPNDCPGGCTNMPTRFSVYAATDGWNAGTVSNNYSGAGWCHRLQTDNVTFQPWQLNGANGAMDREQLQLVTRDVVAAELANPWVIAIDLAFGAEMRLALRARIGANNHLSLIFVPETGGTLFLHSLDGKAGATTLAIRECR
jgi:hypothetical protein